MKFRENKTLPKMSKFTVISQDSIFTVEEEASSAGVIVGVIVAIVVLVVVVIAVIIVR